MTIVPAIPLLTVHVAALMAALLASGSPVRPEPATEPDDYHARPTLISEHAELVPGKTNWIGIRFAIEDGWHTYWPGFNDTGFPADFGFTTTVPAKIGPAVWPAPHRYQSPGGLLDHGFEHEVTVLYPITLDADTSARSITIEAAGDWLVCKVECVPEYAKLSVTLPIAPAGSEPKLTDDAPSFTKARARHAKPRPDDDTLTATWQGNALTFRASSASKLAFYPAEASRSPIDLLDAGEAKGRTLTIEFRPGDQAATPVRGILEIWDETGDRSGVYQIDATP